MASIYNTTHVASKMITNHPYYPLEVEIASYLANEWSVPVLLSMFAGLCGLILVGTVCLVDKVRNRLPAKEKAAVWWFVLSGSIHLFFEGYFSLNHTRMGPAQDLFGQLWKEYALSDSRYLTSDPFVLCMETVTAFTWGPLCFVVALFIIISHPLRHPLSIIVCVGQIYGLILYYATSMFDHFYMGVTYSRPEFLYFWVYYFFMNFIWMVFPGMLLVSSVRKIANAFAALDKLEASSKSANAKTINGKANGHTKKNS